MLATKSLSNFEYLVSVFIIGLLVVFSITSCNDNSPSPQNTGIHDSQETSGQDSVTTIERYEGGDLNDYVQLERLPTEGTSEEKVNIEKSEDIQYSVRERRSFERDYCADSVVAEPDYRDIGDSRDYYDQDVDDEPELSVRYERIRAREAIASSQSEKKESYRLMRSSDAEAVTEPVTNEMPIFPWPPPKSSARSNVPINNAKTIGDISDQISRALNTSGYSEVSFYRIAVKDENNRGLAIISRLERINKDGSPKPGTERWDLEIKPLEDFSIKNYIKALFTSKPGYFRIIMFVITDLNFISDDNTITAEQATAMLEQGSSGVEDKIANIPYSSKYKTTALIYEFKKIQGSEAIHLVPGRIGGKTHLVKANDLWSNLKL